MKPVHILVLVLAGALGGAMLMKVVQRPEPVESALPAESSSPAGVPVTQTQAQAQPVEPPAPPLSQAETPAPQPPVVMEEKPPAPLPRTTVRPQQVQPRQVKRQAPPPANPRPLVVAQMEQPRTQTPAPAPVESAPAPAPPVVVQESPMPQAPPVAPPVENATPPAPEQPVPHTVTLNAGLLIPVRLVDGLSSERNVAGDKFLATIDHELVVDGFVIAERGARVEGRVVASDRGTKVNGGAALTVELIRLHTSDRQVVPIETDTFEKHSQPDRRQDVEKLERERPSVR